MTTWALTVAGNLLLAVLMLFRGYYRLYRVLFVSLIFEVLASAVTSQVYSYYGTSSDQWLQTYWLMKSLELLFCLGIIWETRNWPKIGIPFEAYLFCLICVFIMGFKGTDVYPMNEPMRAVKLCGLAWLAFGLSQPVQYIQK